MSDELKAKLREILNRRHCEACNLHSEKLDSDNLVALIDQAYKDADYFHVAKEAEYLTGQEWYERFEKELEAVDAEGYYIASAIEEAAKRAAGLE